MPAASTYALVDWLSISEQPNRPYYQTKPNQISGAKRFGSAEPNQTRADKKYTFIYTKKRKQITKFLFNGVILALSIVSQSVSFKTKKFHFCKRLYATKQSKLDGFCSNLCHFKGMVWFGLASKKVWFGSAAKGSVWFGIYRTKPRFSRSLLVLSIYFLTIKSCDN
jgi:hypothetical protein